MNKYKLEIKWALIFVGTFLAWMLLERLVGLHDKHIDKHPIYTMLYIIPAIALYVFALKDIKRKKYNGRMTFKQGFIAGMVLTIIVTILSPLTQWIISNIITPHYFENVIAYSVENGHTTLEEAQAYFNYKNYAIQSTISALFMGLVTSLIVAFFVRTKS